MKNKLLLCCYLSIASLAFSEDTANVKLDDSVIKGDGYTRNISFTPKENKNTFVVTQKQIQERNYKNVEDVLRDSPGVIVNNTPFGPRVDMRGSGEKSLSRVKVLVDGININPTEEAMSSLPINSIPIESIKKIEIIPGGGATLYGSGSVGGVVSISTNSNATKNNFFMDLSYGSFDNRNFGLAGGYNLTDALYVNYGFSYKNSEGYRESEEKDNQIFLGGFDYKINEKNKIRFQARRGDEKNEGTTEIKKKDLELNRTAPGLNLDLDTENESFTFDYEYRATPSLTLASTFYHQNQKRKINTESIDDVIIRITDREHTTNELYYGFYDVKSIMEASFEEEKNGINLKAKYDYTKGELLMGYEYYKANNKRNSFVKSETLHTYAQEPNGDGHFVLDPEDRKPIINKVDIDLTKESHGIYAFNKYNVNDKVNFTTGVRGEYTSFNGQRKNGPNSMPLVESKEKTMSTDKDMENYAAELGLLYKYSDTGSIFARYERGFVTPFASQLTDKVHDDELKNPTPGLNKPPLVNVASIYKNNNLESEITDTFEIGLRDYLFNSFLSMSFYVTDTTDEITLIQSGVTNPAIKRWKYRNIGKTRRMGIEAELEQSFDRLTFNESVSLVNAEVLKGDSAHEIYKGDDIPMIPEMKLTLGAKYKLTDSLSLLTSYTYLGDREARELNYDINTNKETISKFDIEGYGTVDLGLLYNIDEYSNLKVGVKNLLDEKYNLRETSIEAFPAPERNYYLELNVKF